MKYLILLLLLPLFLHAGTTNETDFIMTKAEFEECCKNKDKTEQRFLIRQNGKTGFIDGCGRVVIEPIYDSAFEYSGQAFLDRKILPKSVFCHSMSIYA